LFRSILWQQQVSTRLEFSYLCLTLLQHHENLLNLIKAINKYEHSKEIHEANKSQDCSGTSTIRADLWRVDPHHSSRWEIPRSRSKVQSQGILTFWPHKRAFKASWKTLRLISMRARVCLSRGKLKSPQALVRMSHFPAWNHSNPTSQVKPNHSTKK